MVIWVKLFCCFTKGSLIPRIEADVTSCYTGQSVSGVNNIAKQNCAAGNNKYCQVTLEQSFLFLLLRKSN